MRTLICVVLTILSTTIYCQEAIQVVYKVTDGSVAVDPKNLENAPDGVKFGVEATSEIFPKLKFKLNLTNSASHFYQEKTALEPIKNYPETMVNLLYKLAESLAGGGEYFLFKQTNQTYNYFESADGVNYLITSPLDKYIWVLSDETKKINGFTCYKATTQKITYNMSGAVSRPVVAWYAPAIPFPFDPKDYNGLPGLILELHEGTIGLYATRIDLNPKQKIEIKKPTKGKQMTQEEYDKSNGASYEKAKNLLGG